MASDWEIKLYYWLRRIPLIKEVGYKENPYLIKAELNKYFVFQGLTYYLLYKCYDEYC